VLVAHSAPFDEARMNGLIKAYNLVDKYSISWVDTTKIFKDVIVFDRRNNRQTSGKLTDIYMNRFPSADISQAHQVNYSASIDMFYLIYYMYCYNM
jgi:hypothetical protein